eukprot:scaffold1637_cov410-Prasinococcus_capsulatus_cf.AAC.23
MRVRRLRSAPQPADDVPTEDWGCGNCKPQPDTGAPEAPPPAELFKPAARCRASGVGSWVNIMWALQRATLRGPFAKLELEQSPILELPR